ncbi:hypothetical protein EAF04_008058 [Stromatinia cepivora]|nr:hypothetical protein EAF04_008058 [Stromatinia cepivora]
MSTSLLDNTDWLVSVAEIPVYTNAVRGASAGGDETPSKEDMGSDDPQNIIYASFKSKKIPDKFKDRVDKLEQMMKLTQQWLDTHAGIQVKGRKKENALPSGMDEDSRWKRSIYRVKVVDHYLTNMATWIYNPRGELYRKHIETKKVDFHMQLIQSILTGLIVPTQLHTELEKIFKGISDTIAQTQNTSEGRVFWSLIQVFTYDEMRDDVRASLRCITYNLTQDMSKIVVGKASYEKITVDFYYNYGDYDFNEKTWSELEPEVNSFIIGLGKEQIRDTTKIPV